MERSGSGLERADLRTRSGRTLADVVNSRNNSLNAVRLVLALLVVVSHVWPLNGWGWQPSLGGLTLGAWAVLGFFGVSGYLITLSRFSPRPAMNFWVARALRIFPGLLVALVIVAFVAAPVSVLLQQGAVWNPVSSFTFFLRNAPLYPYGSSQSGIEGTLLGFQQREWNGPLWTLFWEGSCYVIVGIGVGVIKNRRALNAVLAAVVVGGTSLALSHRLDSHLQGLAPRIIPMMVAFAVGALLASTQDRLPVNRRTMVAALAGLFVVVLTGTAGAFAGLFIPFVLLVLGGVLPLQRVGRRVDMSYGIYIYAWPVQQLVVLLLGPRAAIHISLLVVIPVTCAMAAGSYILIERPAISARRPIVAALSRVADATLLRARRAESAPRSSS